MIVTLQDLSRMTLGFTLEYFPAGHFVLLMYSANSELLDMLEPDTDLWFCGHRVHCSDKYGIGPARTEVRFELRTI